MLPLFDPVVFAAEAPDPRAALVEASRAWQRRDRPGVIEETLASLEVFRAANPDDYEVHWQIARFWHALSLRGDKPQAQTAFSGVTFAERATQLNPKGVEGWFWLASTLGSYAEKSGIVDAVRQGLAGRIEAAALKAVALNPGYDHGAPLVALGQYYYALPWPLQDVERARSYMERAVAAGPKYALNLYFLAEMEWSEGNHAAAKVLFERIIALGPSDGDPPATRRYQPLAKARLAELAAL